MSRSELAIMMSRRAESLAHSSESDGGGRRRGSFPERVLFQVALAKLSSSSSSPSRWCRSEFPESESARRRVD